MTAASEAARQIRREESDRARLYSQFSPIVGAFDAADMSAADIAAYSLTKLGLRVPSDDRAKVEAANSYLMGRNQAAAIRSGAMDARPAGSGDSVIDRYIRGES